jgi:hypothetical protein
MIELSTRKRASKMSRIATKRTKNLAFESLEGRALLSVAAVMHHHVQRTVQAMRDHRSSISDSDAGEGAILSAINGGAGHEFATLIKREVPNIFGVAGKFESGAISEYTIPGFVVRTPDFQPLYTGGGFDRMLLVAAGAVLLKGNVLELGAIANGPFARSDATSQVVFAINRGEGRALGPAFPSVPGITPDALVRITIGPYASSYSGTITDLTTGATQAISPNDIQVNSVAVRVLVNSNQIPSKGLPLKKYTYASWTELSPYSGIILVGSFAPEETMNSIGVLTTVKPPKL